MKKIIYFILIFCFFENSYVQATDHPFIQILGITQDGGYPHGGCSKKCCATAWQNDSLKKFVVSFALVDSAEKKWWLFEATPDIKYQLQYFKNLTSGNYYWLAIWTDASNVNVYYSSDTGGTLRWDNGTATWPTWPSPLVTGEALVEQEVRLRNVIGKPGGLSRLQVGRVVRQ